jgi:hypothetical protein
MVFISKRTLIVRYSRIKHVFFAACILFVAGACGDGSVDVLPKQELFSLSLGKMDDQLDLFNTGRINRKNSFFMRDGFFYIANGNSLKILQYSSFGDLLLLLYNSDPAINPPTSILKSNDLEDRVSNRIAAEYPFIQVGEIASDSAANIYVEDRVAREQIIEDKNEGVLLASRILVFSNEGKLEHMIGQEGIGGTPFPYISRLFITRVDDLVVVCTVPRSTLVFWYSKDGSLLHSLEFRSESLPNDEKSTASLVTIQPDLVRYQLYVQLLYFTDEIDQSTNTKSTVKDTMNKVYTYDVDSRKFVSSFVVPDSGRLKIKNDGGEVDIPAPSYEFLGVNVNGYYYFLRPEGINDMRLLILDPKGREEKSRILSIDESDEFELFYKYLHLSYDGIISAFLGTRDSVNVVWWRTDTLIGGVQNEK